MASEKTDRFGFVATVVGFIVDSATILSWLLNLIAALTLASQAEVPRFFNTFRLGPGYQLLLLFSAGFVYLHFLRRYWRKEMFKKSDDPISIRFRDFLWRDLPSLKRPLLLIPIFIFYCVWLAVAILLSFR